MFFSEPGAFRVTYVISKQTGSTLRDTNGRNIHLTPPPQLYSNVGRKLFLT